MTSYCKIKNVALIREAAKKIAASLSTNNNLLIKGCLAKIVTITLAIDKILFLSVMRFNLPLCFPCPIKIYPFELNYQ